MPGPSRMTAGQPQAVLQPKWTDTVRCPTDRFQTAANEATLSRIFAGQHTMTGLVAGQQLGRHVGDFVLGHFRPAAAGPR